MTSKYRLGGGFVGVVALPLATCDHIFFVAPLASDITGLQMLLEVIEPLRKRGIVVKVCEANERVLGKLDKAGILQALGS